MANNIGFKIKVLVTTVESTGSFEQYTSSLLEGQIATVI